MLYDKITCQHTGLTGHTQPGVFKFNPYWNENMEEPRRLRKRDMRIARSKYVFGYPKPRFELVSESEDEYDEDEDDEEGSEEREGTAISGRKADTPKTAKTTKTTKTRDEDDDDDDDEDDDDYDSDDYDDEYDEEEEDYIPYRLPEIGYPQTPSLPPSSQSFRSRHSDFTESVPDSLPSLPPTRQLTAQTKRTGVTQVKQR
jgi:hypothetical protein